MALLLAMFQKLRLKREYNQCAYQATKFSSKISRVEKSIQKAQKRYTSLFAQIDSQAKMMTSQAKNSILNMSGLGMNGNNGLTSIGGMSAFVMNTMAQGLAQGGWFKYKDESGEECTLDGMDNSKIQQMMSEYVQNGGRFVPKADPENEGKYLSNEYENWSPEEVSAFYSAIQRAQQMQSMATQQANSMCNQYENNVSIWVEAQKARLEAEQDAVLEPLNYEQTMLELDKDLNDQKMTRLKAEMESYDQLCSEEAKNSAPTFGLR